jgi:methionine aminopeptidase
MPLGCLFTYQSAPYDFATLKVQVDGMIAMVGTSVVVGGADAASEDANRALQAARDAAVVVNSMLKPGTKSSDIVAAISAVASTSNLTLPPSPLPY